MKTLAIKTLFVGALVLLSVHSIVAQKKGIEVQLSGIEKSDGDIIVSIYKPDSDFPDQPYKHYVVKKDQLKDGALSYVLEEFPKGKYAVVILDDENSSNDMDYNFMGIPKEGYGFSTNFEPGMTSKPSFERCDFYYDGNYKLLKIKMIYW